MNVKAKYRTKQREELLSYLETVPGVHLTVGEICATLAQKGSTMGQTTVYRQLETLLEEGLVNKYSLDVKSPACYEYVPIGSHVATLCFHCKCQQCGRLYHLHCQELEGIAQHLKEEHHFLLNPRRTVFFGLCEECQKLEEEKLEEEKLEKEKLEKEKLEKEKPEKGEEEGKS